MTIFHNAVQNLLAVSDTTDAGRVYTPGDARHQFISGLTTGRDRTMPQTGIQAGEVWLIENTTTQIVTMRSADGQEMKFSTGCNLPASIGRGYVRLRSLQASPSTPAHWQVIEVDDEGFSSALTDVGAFTAQQTVFLSLRRRNDMVTMSWYMTANATGNGVTSINISAAIVPERFRVYDAGPGLTAYNPMISGAMRRNGLLVPGTVDMGTSGILGFRTYDAAVWGANSNVGRDGNEPSYGTYIQKILV